MWGLGMRLGEKSGMWKVERVGESESLLKSS